MLWRMAGKHEEQKREEVGEKEERGEKEVGGMTEECEKNSVEKWCDNRKMGREWGEWEEEWVRRREGVGKRGGGRWDKRGRW